MAKSERIAGARPADRTAALVTGKASVSGPELNLGTDQVFDSPMPISKSNRQTAALRGVRFGTLVVIGLSSERRGRYVCRCNCGHYCFRTLKRLRKAQHVTCGYCVAIGHLKDKAHWLATGRDRDDSLRFNNRDDVDYQG